MTDPNMASALIGAVGVLCFVLGMLCKYGWDSRAGGIRDRIGAREWEMGRRAGARGRQAPAPAEPQDAADSEWTATLETMPRVPAHEPSAELGAILAAKRPEVYDALLVGPGKPRDLELETELAMLPGLEALACPRCGGTRWRTVEKGARWACRQCGYERGPGDGDSDPRGQAGRGADPGRDGDTEPDHAPILAGSARPLGWLLADWDARAAERRATLADQAAAAEFAVWETEMGGLIAGAYDRLGIERPAPRQLEVHHGRRVQ